MDSDREVIIKGLLATGAVHVTALNVFEAVKHGGAESRRELLKLLRQLSPPGKGVLAMPNDLLERAARAFSTNEARFATDSTSAREVLDGDSEAEDELSKRATEWAESVEAPFKQAHLDGREEFQDIFRQSPGERPNSRAAAIRQSCQNDDLMHSFVSPAYAQHVGQELDSSEARNLLRTYPEWALHWLGWVHQWYERGVQPIGYGWKRKPGAIDLSFAVYLPLCDRFVTTDKGQFRALRMLNVYNRSLDETRRTEVLLYDQFRRRLVLN